MSAMLGLVGRITESLKMLNKQLGAIVWQAIANKPIWMLLAAAVISVPSLAETQAVDGAEVATKLVSSGKVVGENLDQGSVKHMTAKKNTTVKARESSCVYSGAECGGGSSKANFVSVAPSKVAANTKEESATDEVFEVQLLIPMAIALWVLFTGSDGVKMNTPQRRGKGRALARPS